jgi:hypothetical protein
LSCVFSLFLAAITFGRAPKTASPEIGKKVDVILSKMTLEQKVDMLGGVHDFDPA